MVGPALYSHINRQNPLQAPAGFLWLLNSHGYLISQVMIGHGE